ncbi:response regulator transcription factor [Roseateles amylovorans]|uniref:Response regulator transcription factor n=1 Tax=Roseateles amylovorans TaxID=2978473 RepID=A0ABY6B325_9BURK|nr:response regulator transcription factor [Roseateles amylovorans]UXH78379.1 response regulator transcription factor [Roseateles amylovorans]
MFSDQFHRIRVRVAHRDPVVAIGLKTVFSRHPDIEVLDESSTSAPTVKITEAEVVVTDYDRGLHLAQRRGGALVRPYGKRGSDGARVLVLTGNDREHDVRSALEAGVEGYLEMGCDPQELLTGVRQLAGGSCYLSALAAQRVAASMGRCRLTEREREVLTLVAFGRSNKAAALVLKITAGTVKAHMKSILSKLGARTRTQAASIGRERGLIGAPHHRD